MPIGIKKPDTTKMFAMRIEFIVENMKKQGDWYQELVVEGL